GVVHPPDLDAEEFGCDPELAPELRARALRRIVHELGRDTDRERLDGGHALTAGDREVFPVDPCFERAIHRLQKIVAVVLRVEAEDRKSTRLNSSHGSISY